MDTSSSGREHASKAAAWMWHLHNGRSPTFTMSENREDKLADNYTTIWDQGKRRIRSTSCDHKDSRFRHEASPAAAVAASASGSANMTPVASVPPSIARESSMIWDCGSNLYDTYELISFSNRLERSLLAVPGFDAPKFRHAAAVPPQSPLCHGSSAAVFRTFSLPLHYTMPLTPSPANHDNEANKTLSSLAELQLQGTFSPPQTALPPIQPKFSAGLFHTLTTKWTLPNLVRLMKKVGKLHNQMQCFRAPHACGHTNVTRRGKLIDDKDDDGGMSEHRHFKQDTKTVQGRNKLIMGGGDNNAGMASEHRYSVFEANVNEGKDGKQFHHHHHHYHHHIVHAKEDTMCKFNLSWDGKEPAAAWRNGGPGRANSARLSSDTMLKICGDVNWL